VTIYRHGATVTSWKLRGQEMLFLSEKAIFNGKSAIRGGIPIVFPQFGPGKLPSHGFARVTEWEVGTSRMTPESASVVLLLTDSEQTREAWGAHAFRLELHVTLFDSKLRTILRVVNTGETAFEFQALQHTYYAITDVARVAVRGLRGKVLTDKLRDMTQETEEREAVTIDREVDRIYADAPEQVELDGGPLPLVISLAYGLVDASDASSFAKREQGDVVVWNPWVDKSRAMGDFGDEEFHRMVCVEPGHVSDFRPLQPGEMWRLQQEIRPRL